MPGEIEEGKKLLSTEAKRIGHVTKDSCKKASTHGGGGVSSVAEFQSLKMPNMECIRDALEKRGCGG